jgi:DHA3 family macrolide efflux protein-like MFS transporter
MGAVEGTPDRGPRVTFALVLSRRDYFRVWLSQGISYIGDRLTQVALFVYIIQIADGSAMAVGLSMIAQSAPVVLFGLVAGVFVDRWDKKKTMVICDLLRAGIIATAPLTDNPLVICLIAFLMSAVTSVFSPALQAATPELLGDRREILVANSLMYSTKFLTDILGFSVAAVVVAMGVKVAFVIDAASFLLSALLLVGVKRRLGVEKPEPVTLAGVWSDFVAGFRYHRQNVIVLSLLISFSLGVLAMGGLNAMLLLAVQQVLHAKMYWWSLFLAVQAVAMFATAAAIGRWGHKVPKPHLILLGFLGVGFCAIGLAVTRVVPLAFVLYALMGAANSLFLVPSIAWTQELVPFEYRGRVFSLRGMVLNLAAIISYGATGVLGDAIGVAPVLSGVGAALCLTTIISAFLPGFRETLVARRPASPASPAQETA